MFHAAKVLASLEQKHEHFKGVGAEVSRQLDIYREALRELGLRYPAAGDMLTKLATRADGAPVGALPTPEYDRWRALVGAPAGGLRPVFTFHEQFEHHQESRAWAEAHIRGITTLAVDGSQVLPWRDVSLPVALIQAGLFENPHDPARPYTKDVFVEVLSPSDLADAGRQHQQTGATGQQPANGYSSGVAAQAVSGQRRPARGRLISAEQQVHLCRFELEARTIVTWMRRYREREGTTGSKWPLVFFDGSLIVTFALTMPQEAYRERYASAALSLLEASETYRIPLIGYIDTSDARDMTALLTSLFEELPETSHVHDALLWQGALAWGDRTPAFLSARGGVLQTDYGRYAEGVAFVYLQTTGHRPPARLEFPRWILDEGLLDGVLDVVRAEVIAGNGYPYAIETADAVAVISMRDREEFYRLFQEFAIRNDLGVTFSSKALSKSRRRL
jgi:hypothetical protein